MRLAAAVHGQGYKVALTGEGADEALAGYVWFKSQMVRDWIDRRSAPGRPAAGPRAALLAAVGGGSAHRAARCAIGGVRTAQQDMYELIGQSRPILYTDGDVGPARRPRPVRRPGHHQPTGSRSWAPLNQSLYVGYKVMLAGLLMISKGDRIAMHSSVETRYPFLDEDVIEFCSGIAPEYKLRGHDREVDPAPGRRQDASRRRSPTGPRRCSGPACRGPSSARTGRAWVDQLLSPEIAPRDRATSTPRPSPASVPSRCGIPRITPAPVRLRRGADLRRLDPALAPPLLRRRPLRPARPGRPRRRQPRRRPAIGRASP